MLCSARVHVDICEFAWLLDTCMCVFCEIHAVCIVIRIVSPADNDTCRCHGETTHTAAPMAEKVCERLRIRIREPCGDPYIFRGCRVALSDGVCLDGNSHSPRRLWRTYRCFPNGIPSLQRHKTCPRRERDVVFRQSCHIAVKNKQYPKIVLIFRIIIANCACQLAPERYGDNF